MYYHDIDCISYNINICCQNRVFFAGGRRCVTAAAVTDTERILNRSVSLLA